MNEYQQARLRRELNVTQAAAAIDVKPDTVAAWETGASIPSPRNLARMAKTYQCPIICLEPTPRSYGDHRRQQGWTQADLAVETGLTKGQVAAIETGRRTPTDAESAALQEALGMDSAQLTVCRGQAIAKWLS